MKQLLGVFALIVVGCSLLVEPTDEVRCTPGADECPDGYSCEEDGVCREMCVPPGMPEICNGRDDDCNGEIDEGLADQQETCNAQDDDCDGRVDEGYDANSDGTIDVGETFDKDDDGFNTCGSNCDEPDGSCVIDPDRIDCNDTQPIEGVTEGGGSINPNAEERCDGTDRDCDGDAFPLGEPDETCQAPRDVLCGGGQICEPDRGCIPLDCNSGRPCSACGVRQICLDGRCEDTECDSTICEGMNQWCGSEPECLDKLPNGEECNRHVECLTGFCDTGGTLGLPTGAAGLCFEACCSDSDCPSGEFCYGPGTGARSCIRPRPGLGATGRTAVGSGGAGAACSTGAECRSGRCDGAAGCFAACGQSSECPGACGITDEGLGCRAGGDFRASCSSGADCAMALCGANCLTQSCRSGSSCPDSPGNRGFCDPIAVNPGGGLQAVLACTYAPQADGMANNVNHGEMCDRNYCINASDCCITVLGVCVSTFATGCNTGTCLSGRCTTACCTDESCPGSDVCRPQSQSIEGGTFFPMYCVPPA